MTTAARLYRGALTLLFVLVAVATWVAIDARLTDMTMSTISERLANIADTTALNFARTTSALGRVAYVLDNQESLSGRRVALTGLLLRATAVIPNIKSAYITNREGLVAASSELDVEVESASGQWLRQLFSLAERTGPNSDVVIIQTGTRGILLGRLLVPQRLGASPMLLVVSLGENSIQDMLGPTAELSGVNISLLDESRANVNLRLSRTQKLQRDSYGHVNMLMAPDDPIRVRRNVSDLGYIEVNFQDPSSSQIWKKYNTTMEWLAGALLILCIACALGMRRGDLGRQVDTLRAALENSERRRQELTDALAASQRERQRVLMSVGHDVRTPIASILGIAALLQETDLQEEQRRWVGTVSSSCETLLAMLNGILEIARDEARQNELFNEKISVAGLLRNVAAIFEEPAREKSLELRIDIVPALERLWGIDATRLRQVVFNLLGNAIKYTMVGKIELTAALLDGEPARLQIVIADTGVGVPAGEMERIFAPFERGSLATSSGEGGLGIGLAIARGNAKLMRGNLVVESSVGVGSEFTFTCEIERVEMTSRQRPYEGHVGIVIGFQDVQRRRLALQLEELGFSVETSQEGFVGYGIMERLATVQGGLDLTVIDAGVSGLPVEALIRRLRPSRHFACTRILVVSQHKENLESVAKLGVQVLTTSDDRIPDIAAAVEGVMAGYENLHALAPTLTVERLMRVLVVEDNKINQSLLLAYLDRKGMEVSAAENGEEAVRLSSRTVFDAILMDVQLPGIDGLEATRRIRKLPGYAASIPIVGLTALTGSVVWKRCQAAGMTGLMEKPFNLPTLARDLALSIEESRLSHSSNGGSLVLFVPKLQDDDIAGEYLEAVYADVGWIKGQACLREFVLFTHATIESIKSAVDAWEEEKILRLAHEFEGVGGTFGLTAVCRILVEIQNDVRGGGETNVLIKVKQLASLTKLSVDYLLQLSGELRRKANLAT